VSLDVYLRVPGERNANQGDRIYVRRDGATVEITRDEWDEMYPGRAPVVVTADPLDDGYSYVYDANITHNLGKMAAAVAVEGNLRLYDVLWRPDEHGLTHARDLIVPLRDGLAELQSDPDSYREYNPANGWGDYDGLVRFVVGYLTAVERWPDAEVEVSR